MEMMIYAFGLGLSFMAGLTLGGWLIGRVAGKKAAQFGEEAQHQRDLILKHHDRVEARLTESAKAQREIADAIKSHLGRAAV